MMEWHGLLLTLHRYALGYPPNGASPNFGVYVEPNTVGAPGYDCETVNSGDAHTYSCP